MKHLSQVIPHEIISPWDEIIQKYILILAQKWDVSYFE